MRLTPQDDIYMEIALRMAARGLGLTAPNPSVGCVLVRDGIIVGRGVTAQGGRPHAEAQALAQAGEQARGATAYVTLEPCSHHGKTPPCAHALHHAGVARVVVATRDPDPRVDGSGIEYLKKNGIEVHFGLKQEEANALNQGFFLTKTAKRPLITLKMATTLDGKIATRTGESQWISSEPSRQLAHLLRKNHDAIMVGSGTVLQDNPQLTCRLSGLESSSPIRIVLDRRLRTPLDATLVTTARKTPSWLITNQSNTAAFESQGVVIRKIEKDSSLPSILAMLVDHGITRLMVEGGGKLAASFIAENLIDHLIWVHAPMLLGSDAIGAIDAIPCSLLKEAPRFKHVSSTKLGEDTVTVFSAQPPYC